ncbi:hypothetical protein [Ethanoligenens sp.]|uniref:hypothetical protein n=1 Tax=Ethanoligenens sp. TaxID=2099655 RepID=UPI0039EA1017
MSYQKALKRLLDIPSYRFQSYTTQAEVLNMFAGLRFPNIHAERIAARDIGTECLAKTAGITCERMCGIMRGNGDLGGWQRKRIKNKYNKLQMNRTEKYLFSDRLAYYDLSDPKSKAEVMRTLRNFSNILRDVRQTYALYPISPDDEIVESCYWKGAMDRIREPETIMQTGIYLYAEKEHLLDFGQKICCNLQIIEDRAQKRGYEIQQRPSKTKEYRCSRKKANAIAYATLRDELEDAVRRHELKIADAMHRARQEAIRQVNEADVCERLVPVAS